MLKSIKEINQKSSSLSKNSVLRTLYCLGFILLILSCAKNEKTVTANDILVNTIDASGGDYFNNSTVSFNMADLDYKLFRKDNIAEYGVTWPCIKRYKIPGLLTIKSSIAVCQIISK